MDYRWLLAFVGQVLFPPDDQGCASTKPKLLREWCFGAPEQLQENIH